MDHLGTTAQLEQLKAIGTRLSEERQKQSVSLDEIAAKTYIPLRLLTAIEHADMNALPEPVFIQGFIRRYADAIGLDGTTISKEFPVNLSPVPEPPTPNESTQTPTVEPYLIKADSEVARSFQFPKVQLPNVQLPNVQLPTWGEDKRSYLPVVGVGAAVILGIIAISSAIRPKTANPPAPSSVAAAPTSPPAKSPVAKPSPVPVASPSPAGTVGVKINVTDDSWVQVLVDGEQVFEGTLPKGTQRTWTGKKQVEITAGNAGGVSVSYNNATFKPMGAAGDVQTASFPPTNP